MGLGGLVAQGETKRTSELAFHILFCSLQPLGGGNKCNKTKVPCIILARACISSYNVSVDSKCDFPVILKSGCFIMVGVHV